MPKSTSPIFQADIVRANLHDQLTAEQIRMLRRSVFVYQSALVTSSMMGFLTFVCLVTIIQNRSAWICMGVLNILVIALLLEWVLKSWRDARPGQVVQVTGRVLGTYSGGRNSSYYHISIVRPDGVSNTIYAQKQEAKLFERGKSYTFFYAERTRILLSAVEVV